MESSFSIDVKKEKEQTQLLFAGDLNINHMSKIKSRIAETVDFSDNLNIHVTNPSGIDITFIQLIYSLKKTCEAQGKSFKINGNFSEEMYGLVSNAGFDKLFKL
jgi:ABC-type transporter Mla MlaB component